MRDVVLLRIIIKKKKIRLIFTCELKFRKEKKMKRKLKNTTNSKRDRYCKNRPNNCKRLCKCYDCQANVIDQCGSDSVDFSLENEWKTGKYYRQ